MAEANVSSRMKADANAMIEAIDSDDPTRLAQAGAAVLGGVIGWMIREKMIEPGRAGEVFDLMIEIAHEFARAEAMEVAKEGAGDA